MFRFQDFKQEVNEQTNVNNMQLVYSFVINPFLSNVPLLYLLKASENQRFLLLCNAMFQNFCYCKCGVLLT